MSQTHIKVCQTCPFKKDSLRGFLADYTAESLHRLVMSEQYFPCHSKLPNHLENIPFEEAHKYPRCVGSIAYMKKGFKMPLDKELKEEMNSLPYSILENTLGVKEFFQHHNPDLGAE